MWLPSPSPPWPHIVRPSNESRASPSPYASQSAPGAEARHLAQRGGSQHPPLEQAMRPSARARGRRRPARPAAPNVAASARDGSTGPPSLASTGVGRRRPDTSRSARAAAAAAPRAGRRGPPRPDGRTRGAAARLPAARERRARASWPAIMIADVGVLGRPSVRGPGFGAAASGDLLRQRLARVELSPAGRARRRCGRGGRGPSRAASPRQAGVPAHDRVVESQLPSLDQAQRERRRRDLGDAVEGERGVRRHRPPRLHHRVAGRAAPHAAVGEHDRRRGAGDARVGDPLAQALVERARRLAVSRGPGGAGAARALRRRTPAGSRTDEDSTAQERTRAEQLGRRLDREIIWPSSTPEPERHTARPAGHPTLTQLC